jgi:hypothetical protein
MGQRSLSRGLVLSEDGSAPPWAPETDCGESRTLQRPGQGHPTHERLMVGGVWEDRQLIHAHHHRGPGRERRRGAPAAFDGLHCGYPQLRASPYFTPWTSRLCPVPRPVVHLYCLGTQRPGDSDLTGSLRPLGGPVSLTVRTRHAEENVPLGVSHKSVKRLPAVGGLRTG